MKRRDEMSVGEIMDMMISEAGLTDEYNRQRLCFLWAEVVGPFVNRHTMRRFVTDTTLHVYLNSAALKEELSYMLPQLVERLNQAVGAPVITDIAIH